MEDAHEEEIGHTLGMKGQKGQKGNEREDGWDHSSGKMETLCTAQGTASGQGAKGEARFETCFDVRGSLPSYVDSQGGRAHECGCLALLGRWGATVPRAGRALSRSAVLQRAPGLTETILVVVERAGPAMWAAVGLLRLSDGGP
jgi:hypothetical protein